MPELIELCCCCDDPNCDCDCGCSRRSVWPAERAGGPPSRRFNVTAAADGDDGFSGRQAAPVRAAVTTTVV